MRNSNVPITPLFTTNNYFFIQSYLASWVLLSNLSPQSQFQDRQIMRHLSNVAYNLLVDVALKSKINN